MSPLPRFPICGFRAWNGHSPFNESLYVAYQNRLLDANGNRVSRPFRWSRAAYLDRSLGWSGQNRDGWDPLELHGCAPPPPPRCSPGRPSKTVPSRPMFGGTQSQPLGSPRTRRLEEGEVHHEPLPTSGSTVLARLVRPKVHACYSAGMAISLTAAPLALRPVAGIRACGW